MNDKGWVFLTKEDGSKFKVGEEFYRKRIKKHYPKQYVAWLIEYFGEKV